MTQFLNYLLSNEQEAPGGTRAKEPEAFAKERTYPCIVIFHKREINLSSHLTVQSVIHSVKLDWWRLQNKFVPYISLFCSEICDVLRKLALVESRRLRQCAYRNRHKHDLDLPGSEVNSIL